ncbi:uncharacterized protein LOC127252993 [Andrographis paniculata]|uniref:uncharacterized protein LOC127252993 n=1 Tax=Andrographis paniculata TaxID=175694 RepID=UPI0021E8B0CE|nr:uncharacterized protein LOC127252993 [Andrographis paniculata]
MIYPQEMHYKPAALKDPNMSATGMIGFIKDSKHHIDDKASTYNTRTALSSLSGGFGTQLEATAEESSVSSKRTFSSRRTINRDSSERPPCLGLSQGLCPTRKTIGPEIAISIEY